MTGVGDFVVWLKGVMSLEVFSFKMRRIGLGLLLFLMGAEASPKSCSPLLIPRLDMISLIVGLYT